MNVDQYKPDDGSRESIELFMANRDANVREFVGYLEQNDQYWKARVLLQLLWSFEQSKEPIVKTYRIIYVNQSKVKYTEDDEQMAFIEAKNRKEAAINFCKKYPSTSVLKVAWMNEAMSDYVKRHRK